MAKKKFGTERKLQSDLDNKQSAIEFSSQNIVSEDLGLGDFRFTSLTASQLAPSDPAQDEGRLYIRDREGVLYYITATKVG
tara:strand:- start:475 stop:717 length:243 start_codon:yes stop_codon:yes gene_type:complete